MSKYNLTDILEQYKIGSGWTTDFDYDGMLKAGLKAGVDTDIEVLKKMAEDYTDVNYHREASHLYNAIEALEEGAIKEASMFFGDFHAEIKQTIKDQGMNIEPTVGQFMASKMEEGKGVEEVTSRESSRMEGLVDQRMKAKLLDIFGDLYFDLTDEDPFQAEDVVDYLGNEMLKHLDNIQAQGDRLAGVNTDGDFEREQRMQMDMREENEIEEGISTSDITKALKDDAKATDSEIKQYMASVKKAGDKFDDVDDYVEDFKNYVADKSLQEHFGRFMKDYQ